MMSFFEKYKQKREERKMESQGYKMAEEASYREHKQKLIREKSERRGKERAQRDVEGGGFLGGLAKGIGSGMHTVAKKEYSRSARRSRAKRRGKKKMRYYNPSSEGSFFGGFV